MLKLGLMGLLDARRRARGLTGDKTLKADAQETFRQVYAEGAWVVEEGQESRSGTGSSAKATAGIADAIGVAMRELGCASLVDVGCGDWNWMRLQAFDYDYTGVDIVPEVIARNSEAYSRANVRFAVCNAIEEPPPKADMAVCREVLFHLSFDDAKAVIANIAKSARYLCATTDADLWFNSDIRTGDFRMLNLMRAPLNLPEPIGLIPDTAVAPGRFLGVWRLDQLDQSA